jgi:hypothetical protein
MVLIFVFRDLPNLIHRSAYGTNTLNEGKNKKACHSRINQEKTG